MSFIVLSIASLYYFTTVEGDDDEASTKKGFAAMVGITCGLVAILFAACVWCKWDDLKLAIEIVNASADFLAQTKRLLVTPLVYFVFLFIFFLFWLSCIICVMSMGKITADPDQDKLIDMGKPWVPLYKDVDWSDRKD